MHFYINILWQNLTKRQQNLNRTQIMLLCYKPNCVAWMLDYNLNHALHCHFTTVHIHPCWERELSFRQSISLSYIRADFKIACIPCWSLVNWPSLHLRRLEPSNLLDVRTVQQEQEPFGNPLLSLLSWWLTKKCYRHL